MKKGGKWPQLGRFDDPVNSPGLITGLRRALGLQRTQAGHLAPDWQVGVTAADLSAPEYLFNGETRQWLASATIAAVVGEFGAVQLVARSPNLTIIRRVIVSGSAAPVAFRVGMPAAGSTGVNFTNVLQPAVRDNRQGVSTGQSSSSLLFGTLVAPTLPISPLVLRTLAGTSLSSDTPWVLAPSDNAAAAPVFLVISLTTNVAVDISIEFEERVLLPSEPR